MTISEDEVVCRFERLEIFVWLEESAGTKGYEDSNEQGEVFQ